MEIQRNPTRAVRIGSITIGDGNPIAVQSMTATKTQNTDATIAQAQAIADRGAGVVRIAVDSDKDAAALEIIRDKTLRQHLQTNARQSVERFSVEEMVNGHQKVYQNIVSCTRNALTKRFLIVL